MSFEAHNAPVLFYIHPVASVSSEIINKCQCVSSTGSLICPSHNRTSTMFDRWSLMLFLFFPPHQFDGGWFLFHQSMDLSSTAQLLFFFFFFGNCNLMFRLSSLVCGEFCREWDLYYEAWFGDFVVDSTLTICFQSHIDVLLRTIFFIMYSWNCMSFF